jgi:hypothetical protein
MPVFACKPLVPDARRDAKLDASTSDMAFIGTVTSVKASKDDPVAQGGDFIVNRYFVSVRRVSTLKGQTPVNLDFDVYTGCGSFVPNINEQVVVFSRDGSIRVHGVGDHYEQIFRAALEGKR